jgi:two-component system sensor kinase
MPDAVPLSSPQVSERWVAVFKRLSVGASLVAILIGVLVLIGWQFGILFLTRMWPGLAAMSPNTAAVFLLSGLALLFLQGTKTLASRLGQVCALLVLVIALATTGEHLLNQDFGIDNLLPDQLPVFEAFSTRMALNAALSFAAIGLALLLLDTVVAGQHPPAELLSLGTLVLATLALLGYLYGIPALYDITSQFGMPVPTMIAFIALSLGTLCARPDRGFMALLCSDGAGGMLARRLLPGGIAIPFLLDWLGFRAAEAGLYSSTLEAAIHVVLVSILLGILVLVTSDGLEQIDLRRKRIEEERTRALEKLEATNKELEAFSYSVSHDLRTPLAATKNFVQLVLDEHANELSPEASRVLSLAYRNAVDMDALIQGLLSFSRETRHPLNKQMVDLAQLAKDVFDELAKEQRGRQIEFKVDEMPIPSADPFLMKQVYRNLIANAIKFTRARQRAQIHVGAHREGKETAYFVRDNGVGFDMAQSDQLFGVFQRLHSDDEFEGTGVGLAIVQRIIRRHGGRVWAEGQVDKGATIHFTIGGGEEQTGAGAPVPA